MPSWKKLITSGSDAQLRSLALNANTLITSSLVITNAGVRYTSSFNAATSSYIAQFGNTSLIEYTPTSSQLHLYGKISSSINNNTFDWSNSRFTNVQTIQAQTINVQQALNNYGEAAFVSRAASYDLLSASAYYSSLGDAFFSSFTPIFEQKSSLAAVRSATVSWTAVPNTSVARVNYNYNTPADPNGPIKIPNNSVVGWYSVTNRSVNVGNTSPRANYNFNAFIDPDTEEITVLTSDAITDNEDYLSFLTHTLSGSAVIVADSENPTEFLRPFRDVRYDEVTPTVLNDYNSNPITPSGLNGSYTFSDWNQQVDFSTSWDTGKWFVATGLSGSQGTDNLKIFIATDSMPVKYASGDITTTRPIAPLDLLVPNGQNIYGSTESSTIPNFQPATVSNVYIYANTTAYNAASGQEYVEGDLIIFEDSDIVYIRNQPDPSFTNTGNWTTDAGNFESYDTGIATSFLQSNYLGKINTETEFSTIFAVPALPEWQPGTVIKYQFTANDLPADNTFQQSRDNESVSIFSISGSNPVSSRIHFTYNAVTPTASTSSLLTPYSFYGTSFYNQDIAQINTTVNRTSALSPAITSSAGWVDNILWIAMVPAGITPLDSNGLFSQATTALKQATAGTGRFDVSGLNTGNTNQAYIPYGCNVFDIDPTDKTTANGIIGNGTSKLYALKTEYPYLQLYNTDDKFLQLYVQNNVTDPANNELEFRFYIISM